MKSKFLLIVGIGILFVVVFVGAIFMTLPTKSIRHFAEKSLEKQLKQEQSVEIDDISISPLLNVTVKKFEMRPRNVEPFDKTFATEENTYEDMFFCASYVDTQPFIIDEIFVEPKLTKLLKKQPEGKFEVKIQDGTITGDLKGVDKMMEVKAKGNKISLNEFTLLSNLTHMQIYGDLEFDLRAVLNKSSLAEMQVDFTSGMTAMCPKRVKLNIGGVPYIELPFTIFGNITASLELKDDKLIIHSLKSDGPDIKLDVTGDVMLKTAKNPSPKLNIRATILPSEDWVTNNNMKVIYQLCEKHDDGSIELELNGPVKRLKPECGTPIPEPLPELPAVEKSDDKKADAKADETAKAEKKDKKSKDDNAREDKPSLTARPEPVERRRPEGVSDGVAVPSRFAEGERPERSMRARGAERPNMARNRGARMGGERPAGERPSGDRFERVHPNMERATEQIEQNAAREMRRRNRGRNFDPSGNDGYGGNE